MKPFTLRGVLGVMAATLLANASAARGAPEDPLLAGLDSIYASLDKLYQDLHHTPELSLHEEKTAAKLAAQLRALGFEVTDSESRQRSCYSSSSSCSCSCSGRRSSPRCRQFSSQS